MSVRPVNSVNFFAMRSHELGAKIGKLEAELLSFIHHHIKANNPNVGIIHKGMKWIYNSYPAWAANFKGYSEKTIFRAIRHLEKLGYILSDRLSPYRGNRTKWYTIAYDKLGDLLSLLQPHKSSKKCPDHLVKMSRSSGQNDQITTGSLTRITASYTVLNDETLQPMVEECKQPEFKQPTAPSSPTSSSTNTGLQGGDSIKPSLAARFEAAEASQAAEIVQALECVEMISSAMEKPFEIDRVVFAKGFSKLRREVMSPGQKGLEQFREYCSAWCKVPYLMGQKPGKDGHLFEASAGTILSKRFFMYWYRGERYFKVYSTFVRKYPAPLKEEVKEAEEIVTIDPAFDVLVKMNESTRNWLWDSSIEWDGDTLIVKSLRQFTSDHLKGKYEDLFKEAYQTDKVCFMVVAQGENR